MSSLKSLQTKSILKHFSNLLMQNINKKQEYLCFASVSTHIGLWAKPTLDVISAKAPAVWRTIFAHEGVPVSTPLNCWIMQA